MSQYKVCANALLQTGYSLATALAMSLHALCCSSAACSTRLQQHSLCPCMLSVAALLHALCCSSVACSTRLQQHLLCPLPVLEISQSAEHVIFFFIFLPGSLRLIVVVSRNQPYQRCRYCNIRPHASAYVSVRQHASACVSILQHASAYVSIGQHPSAYVSIRQRTSAYASNPHLLHQRCRHYKRLLRQYFCFCMSKTGKLST